jgi:sugar phosphate isomerase/epimerase
MSSVASRISLNQMTTDQWSVAEAVAGCVRHGVPAIGLWRHKVSAAGLAESAKLVRESGLHVSSLCRGGMFPAATAAERLLRIDDNKRAIDEAVTLGTKTLVLVCGPAPDRDIDAARGMVADGIAAIKDHAIACGVRLAIEPLHPMFAGDRSIIVTMAQANTMAENLDVGIAIDVYHVWWDPDVYTQIERARGRIFGFHVNDWIVPLPEILKGRGMMGDGLIQIRRLREAVDAAGYTGPIEVEIFNQKLYDLPGDELMKLMVARFAEYC